MIRRSFLRKLAAVPFFAAAAAVLAATNPAKLKILMKSAWSSDDPTKAAFPFLHGDALSEAGHEIQIFLLGDLSFFLRIIALPEYFRSDTSGLARSSDSTSSAP